MGLRFQKRVHLIPGVRLNLSKRGMSVSVGHRGCWYTTGPAGRRATFGVPGSGLYYSTRLGGSPRSTGVGRPPPKPAPSAIKTLLGLAVVVIVLLVVVQMAFGVGK